MLPGKYYATISISFSNSFKFSANLLYWSSFNFISSITLYYPPPTHRVGIEKQRPEGTLYIFWGTMIPIETGLSLPWNQSFKWSAIALVAEMYAFPLVFYWMKPPLSYISFSSKSTSKSFIFSLTYSLLSPSTSIREASQSSLREWFPQTTRWVIWLGLTLKYFAVWIKKWIPVLENDWNLVELTRWNLIWECLVRYGPRRDNWYKSTFDWKIRGWQRQGFCRFFWRVCQDTCPVSGRWQRFIGRHHFYPVPVFWVQLPKRYTHPRRDRAYLHLCRYRWWSF